MCKVASCKPDRRVSQLEIPSNMIVEVDWLLPSYISSQQQSLSAVTYLALCILWLQLHKQMEIVVS